MEQAAGKFIYANGTFIVPSPVWHGQSMLHVIGRRKGQNGGLRFEVVIFNSKVAYHQCSPFVDARNETVVRGIASKLGGGT